MPSLNDKQNLSYLEATLNEVQRIVGVAYMGIFRVAKVIPFYISLKKYKLSYNICITFDKPLMLNKELLRLQTDITIGESSEKKWLIPKNTIFTGALHEMMRDPDYFDNPTQFMPER